MTKKILFLLTFLLTTLGGGNLALATEYELSGSTYDKSDLKTTWSFKNGLTISNSDDKGWGVNNNYIKLSSGVQYTITGIPSTQTITSVTFEGFRHYPEATGNFYIKEFNGASYSHDTSSGNDFNTATSPDNIGSVSFSELSITSGSFTFTPEGALDFIITITTEDKTIDNVFNYTYPYTWKFDVEAAKWTKSKSQITTNTTDWVVMSTDDEARNRVTTAITVDDIDICYGLTFQADVASANASTKTGGICLDWTNCQLWMNGKLTIPSLKVGQTITFDLNVGVEGDDHVSSTTGNTFTVVKEGSATFTVNDYIRSISVSKALRTLSFDEPSYTIDLGNHATYTATPTPVTDAAVEYSSSDPTVATVDKNTGELTAVTAGTCTITATAAETETYSSATASYILTVNGTQNPTIAWNTSSGLTESDGVWTAPDLPYGNHKKYEAHVSFADGSGVKNGDIRYGLVEGSEGYLTIDTNTGQINPTRQFADDGDTEKVVEVYAYIPAGGSHNAAPRITYKVKIVKGTFSDDLFKENDLYVNVGHTIAPKNNLQSMRWEDIDNITVSIQTGSEAVAVSGDGDNMVEDYKTASPRATYFDIKTPTSGDNADHEVVDWFYPIFKGKTTGVVTFIVTLKSKLYGDKSGEFTLRVLDEETTTGFKWADETQSEYTIYEGDYMLLPEITGNTNGNFSYSVGAANQSSLHKYVYTRRWDSSKGEYVITYNNKNFHKGEGFPNFDLTSDAEGNTPVPEVQADGSDVALLFWNTGTGTENDRLLIYGNKAGTVYLKAFDPQITTRALDIIKIEVKSKEDIEDDFDDVTEAMTFPYTWDFTTNYDWSTEIETGTGNWNWIQNESTYDLGMSSNINYDYADEDKDGKVWGNDNNDPTTDSNELTDKLLVGKEDKVLRGFAGMKIRLGNNGTGSWYSKRDGIHILPYTNSNTPRLRVTTGTHTLILPTPTGEDCPETFKVFVKVKALESGEGTLWVRNADLDRNAPGQNKYHNFKSASEGDVIIYSVNASRGQSLELDLDKVDVYWIAYSTEAKDVARPAINSSLSYAAASYSYPKALDLSKSAEVNSGVTAYYASDYAYNKDAAATNTEGYAVVLTAITSPVPANTGLVLRKNTTDVSTSCYMIADGENELNYVALSEFPSALGTNYLKATSPTGKTVGSNETISSTTYTNFAMAYAYKMYHDPTNPGSVYTDYLFDRDWSFYKIMGDVSISNKKSYLQIPGNLYVDRDGKIVEGAASRRAADDNRPSTKPMLDIIFEDEPSGDHNVTGITSVSDRIIDNDAWYTLQGIRVDAPAKGGIYIHNGRKVVIK